MRSIRKSPAIVNIRRTVSATSRNLAAKESGLQCTSVNNDNFTVLVSGGSRHVHCVAVTFKMTEQVLMQWICIKFCVKFERSSAETVWMIQKAAAMGSWWLAASSWQCAHSCITSLVVFWQSVKSPRWLSPPTAQIWCPATSGFSQN